MPPGPVAFTWIGKHDLPTHPDIVVHYILSLVGDDSTSNLGTPLFDKINEFPEKIPKEGRGAGWWCLSDKKHCRFSLMLTLYLTEKLCQNAQTSKSATKHSSSLANRGVPYTTSCVQTDRISSLLNLEQKCILKLYWTCASNALLNERSQRNIYELLSLQQILLSKWTRMNYLNFCLIESSTFLFEKPFNLKCKSFKSTIMQVWNNEFQYHDTQSPGHISKWTW